jgi:hypothetical protein
MEVKIQMGTLDGNGLDITLVDVWYKENYWKTTSKALGETVTGPFNYDKGHRKAILWDGAGTVIMEIMELDLPVYHGYRDIINGSAFYKVRGKPFRYGEHQWWHHIGKED